MGNRPFPDSIRISQEFGTNPGGYNPAGGHTGRDYAVARGTQIVAGRSGRVLWEGWSQLMPGGALGYEQRWFFEPGYGGIVLVIQGDDGVLETHSHLDATYVDTGNRVVAGQVVGASGNTGSATTGPHDHFEIIPLPANWGNRTYGRVHPGPYVQGAYKNNSASTPSSAGSTGQGSATAAAPLWMTGAERRPQSGGVALDKSLPRRATWHITSDVDPGKQQPSMDAVGSYLERVGYCPHLLWDPVTGRIVQYYPADVGGRALAAWNEDGARHIQIEVLFSQGAVRDGKRYASLSDTPLAGMGRILQWLDAHGIPRAWPMGETPALGTSGTRDVGVWNGNAGHYGHSQVPGNNHTDPGKFPDIKDTTRWPLAGLEIDMPLSNEDLDKISDRVRSSVGYMLNPGNPAGKGTLLNIAIAAADETVKRLRNLDIKGIGSAAANGLMKMGAHWEHERDERGKNVAARIETAKTLRDIQARQAAAEAVDQQMATMLLRIAAKVDALGATTEKESI